MVLAARPCDPPEVQYKLTLFRMIGTFCKWPSLNGGQHAEQMRSRHGASLSATLPI